LGKASVDIEDIDSKVEEAAWEPFDWGQIDASHDGSNPAACIAEAYNSFQGSNESIL
jgi:hypothetical protein